ncbi:hypothetical protein QUC31_016440 [Theobroma cacao]
MGCFLGCFGISTKRKRRKPANRILPGDSQRLVTYEPLDSSVSINLDIPEEPIASNPQLCNKPKERLSIKVKKKVSFNLNVQTYEPIPAEETTTYQFLQSFEEKESEKNGAEAGKGSLLSNSLQMGSYPTNYRYQNCRESYDEEDEVAFEESDLEGDDCYDDDDDYYYYYDGDDSDNVDKDVDDQRQRQEEFLDQFDSVNMESAKGASLVHLDEDKAKNKMTLCASTDGESKSIGCGNARIRSQYLCSVLNPVENTTQWKEIKARAALPPTHWWRKENIALEEEPQTPFSPKLSSNLPPKCNQSRPLLQDIAVDASLSNWLTSPHTDASKATGSTKSCSVAFDTVSSKKSICDGSFSRRSREDRVILEITNLESL